jgi:hypothetical protein
MFETASGAIEPNSGRQVEEDQPPHAIIYKSTSGQVGQVMCRARSGPGCFKAG